MRSGYPWQTADAERAVSELNNKRTGQLWDSKTNIPIFAVRVSRSASRICGRVVAVDWAVDASVWVSEVVQR